MRRFLAAWDAFWNAWKHWSQECPVGHVIWTPRGLTDRQRKDLQNIVNGAATAHRKPGRQEGML